MSGPIPWISFLIVQVLVMGGRFRTKGTSGDRDDPLIARDG
jgi:hypothetical protein